MTQEQVALRSELSTQHISKIERCVVSPTVRTLAQLAACLDVDPAEFFAEADAAVPERLYSSFSADV